MFAFGVRVFGFVLVLACARTCATASSKDISFTDGMEMETSMDMSFSVRPCRLGAVESLFALAVRGKGTEAVEAQ